MHAMASAMINTGGIVRYPAVQKNKKKPPYINILEIFHSSRNNYISNPYAQNNLIKKVAPRETNWSGPFVYCHKCNHFYGNILAQVQCRQDGII